MNKITRNIPNAITCGNLLCGCLALVKAFEGDLVWAAYLVGIAAILDFFDGFAARMLKVSSPIGKDLDSLADMVTFGLVPGVVMFMLLTNAIKYSVDEKLIPFSNLCVASNPIPFIAFVIVIFSAVRLAKFNNDEHQKESFIGLPTPANAILICSIPLIMNSIHAYGANNHFSFRVNYEDAVNNNFIAPLILNYQFLIFLTLILSFLLIAPLPLFSLKFKSFGWKGNEIRFVFLLISLLLLVTLQFVGIPLIIILYVLMSVVNNFLTKSKAG